MTITPPEYQISFHFTLRPAIFKSQTILRQMHCMNDPKMTLNTKVPHINIPTTSESPSFTLLRSIPGVFEIQAILRQVHQTTPKWNHRWRQVDQHWRKIYPLVKVICQEIQQTPLKSANLTQESIGTLPWMNQPHVCLGVLAREFLITPHDQGWVISLAGWLDKGARIMAWHRFRWWISTFLFNLKFQTSYRQLLWGRSQETFRKRLVGKRIITVREVVF